MLGDMRPVADGNGPEEHADASADDDGQAAGRPAPTQPNTWTSYEASQFLRALSDLDVSERDLSATLSTLKRPHPSEMTSTQRAKLLLWLATDDGRSAVAAATHHDIKE